MAERTGRSPKWGGFPGYRGIPGGVRSDPDVFTAHEIIPRVGVLAVRRHGVLSMRESRALRLKRVVSAGLRPSMPPGDLRAETRASPGAHLG